MISGGIDPIPRCCNCTRARDNRDSDSDDEYDIGFFLDENIRDKIAKGSYVDLAKLLPRDKNSYPEEDEEAAVQIVARNGKSYLVPNVDQDKPQISSYFRWHSAFKVYTAIYVKANPNRAYEITQYSYTIESASRSFAWFNVYEYDKMFRHRIERKPHKSWADIHQQGWFMHLRDKRIDRKNFQTKGVNLGNSSSLSQTKQAKRCWRFNKGTCSYGDKCKFDHSCSNCGAKDHGAHKCDKKKTQGTKEA